MNSLVCHVYNLTFRCTDTACKRHVSGLTGSDRKVHNIYTLRTWILSKMRVSYLHRLKTLQRLHSETANFSVRVSQLENAAEALQAQTANNAGILQDMKEVDVAV